VRRRRRRRRRRAFNQRSRGMLQSNTTVDRLREMRALRAMAKLEEQA